MFQMLVRCGNQAKKLIIDGGSCMLCHLPQLNALASS